VKAFALSNVRHNEQFFRLGPKLASPLDTNAPCLEELEHYRVRNMKRKELSDYLNNLVDILSIDRSSLSLRGLMSIIPGSLVTLKDNAAAKYLGTCLQKNQYATVVLYNFGRKSF